MKISQLIDLLEHAKQDIGDVEVTMQGTVLPDGFSANDSKACPDVFESTVESSYTYDAGPLGKRIRLFWQV
jgi:hypothetical protein